MKIIHRISFNTLGHPKLKTEIRNLEVQFKVLKLGNSEMITFEISEDDPRWETIRLRVTSEGISDVVSTKFNKKELLEAEWVRIILVNRIGYPQPEDTWITNPSNYEILCPECKRFKQVAEFEIIEEPKLGNTDFFSVHWTSQLFCTTRVVKELKKNSVTGYELKEVRLYENNKNSEKVKQILIKSILKEGLLPNEKVSYSICNSCGVKKYKPLTSGYLEFKRAAFDDVHSDFMVSAEWFGEGNVAFKAMLISSKVKNIILKNRWKGVELHPICLR